MALCRTTLKGGPPVRGMPWQYARPVKSRDAMTVVKFLNLASYALQLLALWLATRIDLSAHAVSQAEEDLPDDYVTEIYEKTRDDKPRTPSEAETKYVQLSSAKNGKRNGAFLWWAATLAAISIVLQGAATWVAP